MAHASPFGSSIEKPHRQHEDAASCQLKRRMKGALDILRSLLAAAGRGERTALVTVTGVIGSSSRAPGTQLAVSETGAYWGSISGGCVEAAVVGLAQGVIAKGTCETVRLGAGSPYIDIRLPCGGGIDLLVIADPSTDVLSRASVQLEQRQSVGLALHPDGRIGITHVTADAVTGWSAGRFYVRHDPELRLMIIGHGSETEALARLAVAYGAAVDVLTPDPAIAEASLRHGARVWPLLSRTRSAHLTGDRHTAIVMFHDHDWEAQLLVQALGVGAFYVGAMGSRQTHERRSATLTASGVSSELSRRIVGPIGLLPSARDPDTLALSILSQIVDAYRTSIGAVKAAATGRGLKHSTELSCKMPG